MDESKLASLLARLTLEEKVTLLTGRDIWTTVAIESIGLRSMVMSDGPSGVRGENWDERDPSLNLPSAAALSSSWDGAMARRYGAALGVEARRKGVDVVLGPTVNLHRTPFGGRSFEAFSEDPLLTGELAAAYIRGLQEHGVAATVKHYVANDSETDRFTVDARVDERTLRELYLAPFEKAVVDGESWLVMSAYNSVNGTTMSENDLLEDPLSSEWGFDGVVVSDWTAVRTLQSARAAQDVAMPGPYGPWGDALVAAVRDGSIAESVVDRKVLRILRLAARVGALDGFAAAPSDAAVVEDGIAFARAAGSAGTVLLRNVDDILPLDPGSIPRVAVIGHNAELARTQGGGSATVMPTHVVSPLDGIRAALGSSDVTYSLGAVVQKGISGLPPEQLVNPATGGAGLRVRYLAEDGRELVHEDRLASSFVWLGTAIPIGQTRIIEVSTLFTPSTTGSELLGFAALGTVRIFVDGALAVDATTVVEGGDFAAAVLSPPTHSGPVDFVAGKQVELRVEYDLGERSGMLVGAAALTIGFEPDDSRPDQAIADAAAAAGRADVAIVVVGTNSDVESEGYDRTTLALPGRQDDLVRAVAAANPRTIVVVNSGSPVLLPWREDVAAIVVPYFGGQESGNALADILFGAVEPGGRLPTTWPATEADVPVSEVTPRDGRLNYGEGIQVGYRAWLRQQARPAYPFGFGLGYTSWNLGPASVAADGDGVSVSVGVTNTGARRGKQVVQVYAERGQSLVERPIRWLVAFAPAEVEPGQTITVTLPVGPRSLAHWEGGWSFEPGTFSLRIGTSVDELLLGVDVVLDGAGTVRPGS